MTTAEPPAAAAPRRSGAWPRRWRDFRRWRRGRPFWGGLFTVLAGVEILLSGGVDLTNVQIRVGLPGFQYYAIPVVLILCGLLTWFTPAQRIFYGVLAALVAVYSLVGVNLGGFFIGMLLGMVGGALSASWAPVEPEPAHWAAPEDEPENPAESTVADPGARTAVDDLLTGPLTDVLPQPRPSPDSPAYDPRNPRRGTATGGPSPRRSPPLLVITLVPLTLAAVTMTTVHGSRPAQAAPCPPKPAVTIAPNPPLPPPTVSPAPSEAGQPPSPSASPGASATQNSNPIGAVINAIGGWLGLGGQQEPTPTPTPSASPSPTSGQPTVAPTPAAPNPKPPTNPKQPTPTCDAAPPPRPRVLAVPAGQPVVSKRPGLLTGDRVTMSGLSFDGVVNLPTHDGTIRALRFSMRSSTTTAFRLLTTDGDGKPTLLVTDVLTIEGNVKFYTSKFTGKVFGLIELTFTPDSPPPLVLPEMFFTDPEITLVFVACDRLTARPVLHLTTP